MTSPIDLLSRSYSGRGTPMAVEIVRPTKPLRENLTILVFAVVAMFVQPWFLMLLIPAFTDWAPGYRECLAGFVAARILLPTDTSAYRIWTRSPVTTPSTTSTTGRP